MVTKTYYKDHKPKVRSWRVGERQKDMDFQFSPFICCGNDPG